MTVARRVLAVLVIVSAFGVAGVIGCATILLDSAGQAAKGAKR